MKKIFSVPLNPKLSEQDFIEFYNFCEEYKDWIYDIYVTIRVAPFDQDAMGDVIVSDEDKVGLIQNALNFQNYLDIPVSATFNNTTIPPTQSNLDIWIKNFKPLYDAGIRIATIPHTHWMATGQIKAAFPDLMVKNTILRDVRSPQEIINLAYYGFDYINLDRDLMRDRDTLIRLKKAKKWIKDNFDKDIKFSLLANEGCLGECPMMVEHFEYNNTRSSVQPQYFHDPISRISCPKWDAQDPAIFLKTANLPPWKADWEEFLNDLGIDVFKMHGRESDIRLNETMDIIKAWANDDEHLWPDFEKWMLESNLEDKPIDVWREKIKNCKFECWECQYCDKVHDKKSPWIQSDMVQHTAEAIAQSGIPIPTNKIPGLTSPRVKTLLNLLARGVGSYLEVGSYLGATACAVLKDNKLNAVIVDSWNEEIQPERQDITTPPNSKEQFAKNLEEFAGDSNVIVYDNDLFETPVLDYQNAFQMFFYDGPHDQETTANAVKYYWSTLAEEAILVFDDANWQGVVDGASQAIEEMGGSVSYSKLLLNSQESKQEWWNGLYIVVIRKT